MPQTVKDLPKFERIQFYIRIINKIHETHYPDKYLADKEEIINLLGQRVDYIMDECA